jgi:5-formyltetrahydrofolate cyclo-ligase
MVKKEARELFKSKRASLTSSEKLKLDDLLLIQFQKLNWPFLSLVMSFYPVEENKEVNSFIITDYLSFINPGLQIAYPKTDFATLSMQAIICDEEDEFEKNKYNIPEPVKCEPIEPSFIDMVLVPLLAFDKRGYRVGYGKGFYDRFLQQCNNNCLKVGLSYYDAIDVIDDANEFDVPLDFCITPKQAYVF